MRKPIKVLAYVLTLSIIISAVIAVWAVDIQRDVVTVYPQKISGNLGNDGMGLVVLEEPTFAGQPDLGNSGNFPEIGTVGLSTSWALIEPKQGKYDFSTIDNTIDYWVAKGKKINLRICTDTLLLPYTYKGVPDWVNVSYVTRTDVAAEFGNLPVNTVKMVDVRGVDYQNALDTFLAKLVAKYGDNKNVEVVEIRGYGPWGEWHSGVAFDSSAQRISNLTAIIGKWVTAFASKGKVMVLSCAGEYMGAYDTSSTDAKRNYANYLSWSGFDYGMKLPSLSFRRDGFSYYKTDEKLLAEFVKSGKKLPLMAEIQQNAANLDANALNRNWTTATDDMIFKLRPNYATIVGWTAIEAVKVVSNQTGYVDRTNQKMGYRLAVDKAEYSGGINAGSTLKVRTAFSNSGVGRFWYDHKLAVYLMDISNNIIASTVNAQSDFTSVLNGEQVEFITDFAIPSNVTGNTYKIAVAIVDNTNHVPQTRLGNAGEIGTSKIYSIGNVIIGNSTPATLNGETLLTYSALSQTALAANTSYQVSFKYLPGKTLSSFDLIADNANGYYFAVKSGGNTAFTSSWQDVSQQTGYKSFIFTTGNDANYKVEIGSVNFGTITPSDCTIRTVSATQYDFNSSLGAFSVSGTASNGAVRTNSRIEISHTATTGDQSGASISLAANKNYTISFKTKTMTAYTSGSNGTNSLPQDNTGIGAYMYVNYGSARAFEWYEREDAAENNKVFNVSTGSSVQNLTFGMHNDGKYYIDNVIVVDNGAGNYITGSNYTSLRNAAPAAPSGTIPAREGFESMSFTGSIIDPFIWRWGKMTTKGSEVISGKSSLLGTIEAADYIDTGFFVYARTQPTMTQFLSGSTYVISFKYKVLEKASGSFYIDMKEKDSNVWPFSANLENVADSIIKDYSFEITPTSNTLLMDFGIHEVDSNYSGRIIIDELNIRLKNQAGFTPADMTGSTRYEQNNSKITYQGNWITQATALSNVFTLNRARKSYVKGSTAQFSFTGTAFRIIGYRSPSQGTIEVNIDGTKYTVNLYTTAHNSAYMADVFTSPVLSNTSHSVTITLLENTNTYIDAIDIKGVMN